MISTEDYRLSRKKVLSDEKADGKILFTTVRRFKGLEADAIICVDVDGDTFENERKRNAFYVGSSRAKLFLEILAVLPIEEDIIKLSNNVSGGSARNRVRALGAIASGLKVKKETDIQKRYRGIFGF